MIIIVISKLLGLHQTLILRYQEYPKHRGQLSYENQIKVLPFAPIGGTNLGTQSYFKCSTGRLVFPTYPQLY